MSNKPRFPFGGSNRGDEEDDDTQGRPSSGGSRLPNPPNRGSSFGKPDDKKKDDRSGGSKPGSNVFGSRSPFGRKDDDDEDEDEDEDDRSSSRTPFGSKPAGSAFGAKPSGSSGGSGFGNKPNEPAKPGGSAFGAKPGGSSGGSGFGNKPNEPAKPNPFGAKPSGSSGGSGFGNKPNEPAKPGGSGFGNRPNEPAKPSGSGFGNKPNEPAKPNPFGSKPSGSSSGGSGFGNKPNEPAKPNSPFGAKSGTSTQAAVKPNSPFGGKPADKPADKPAGGGLFGAKLPFGNKPADKPGDKKDDKPAAAGGFGNRLPFGNKPADKPGDKKDNKPAAAGGFGSRLPFGNKPADKPGDKPADKPAGGGLLGGRLPFGAKPADKPDDRAAAKPTFGGGSNLNKPAGPSIPGGRPSAAAVASPPKTANADVKKPGSKTPPARGEKVAKPLERGKQIQVQHGLSLDQKLDLVGYALIGSGALMFFAIVSPSEGTITAGIANFLGGFVGRVGLIPLAITCAGIGLWLFIRHFSENPLVIQMHRAIGYGLMFVAFITTAHAVEMLNHPVANMAGLIAVSDALVKSPLHPGGGWLGGTIYKALISVAGEIGVWVILTGFWLVSLMLAFSITLAEISAYIKSVFQWFVRVRTSYVDHRSAAVQAKAMAQGASPIAIESPVLAGAGATPASATLGAGSSSPKKGLTIPERTGQPTTVGAPRLAPAAAPAPGALKSAGSAPFGKAPAPTVDLDEEEADKPVAPIPTRPAPLGTSTASVPAVGSAAKPSPFGARPAANVRPAPAAEDEDLDEAEIKDAVPMPIVRPNPFAAPKPSDQSNGNTNKTDNASDGKPASPYVGRTFGTPAAKPADQAVKPADKPDDKAAGNRNPFGKLNPFGSKPAAPAPVKPTDDKVDDNADDLDDEKVAEVKPATPIGNRPNPFGEKPGGSLFGSRPSAPAPATPTTPANNKDEDDDDLDDERVAEVKPATPIGNRPNPFGEKPGGSLFGSRPSTPATPTAKPADDKDDDADELDDEKVAEVKPATPIGNRPNPFGSRPPGSSFGSNVGNQATAKPAEDEDEDDDLDDEKVAEAKPATTLGSRNPFAKPNPFGSKPATTPADDKDDEDEDDELDDEKVAEVKPATPMGNRPNPFGAKPGGSLFGAKPAAKDEDDDLDEEDAKPPISTRPNPFGTRPPVGQTASTTRPTDDLDDEDSSPATPTGNRPSPFGAKPSGNPFGTRPPQASVAVKADDEVINPANQVNLGDTRPGQVTSAMKPVGQLDKADELDAADIKPATPMGNRPVVPTPTAALTRPVPKPGLATRPQFEDDELDKDDEPKYVSVDDIDADAPPSNGPRPTVAGAVNTPPSNMPRPAAPVLGRPRPGDEPAKPNSMFGRPPAANTSLPTPVNNMPRPASVINTPKPPEAATNPSQPAPSLEGVIVRSKGGHSGSIPDYRELLESGSQQKINEEVLQERARVIEETLSSFSAPGRVVEINPGPVITQFGVEPDYLTLRQGKKVRVKVSQIAKLDADLALALSARSIRIEAPVPGKSYVGIEVPNAETSLVSLRDIMDSEEYQRINSKLRIGLGQSVDGAPIAADLTQMPHLLIAGTTGSGKSVCVNAIITCLLLENSPDDLKMIMVDPKRVELTGYNGIPHLVSPVVVDLERIVGVLKWVTREMDERYKKFAAASARNIMDYNTHLSASEPRLPYLVVVIDELADLMMLAPEETEKVLTRLAQMARATGIHLIVSTQRPSVDVVTGLIKANFPARISFAVASSVDSRVILDSPGAEKLLGRGDMLFQAPDAAAPLRMQGVYVSDAAINRVTRYWKGLSTEMPKPAGAPASALSSPVDFNRPAEPVQSRGERFNSTPAPDNSAALSQRVFGSSSAATTNDTGSEDDEMYEEALELVKRAGKPSIQMLQRRLRIGYTRAARLIELMEKRGAISPADARNASASADVPDEGDENP